MQELWESSFQVVVSSDYRRAKSVLNTGRHPTFVGRALVEKCAANGGLLLFVVSGQDAGVVCVDTRRNVLLVLCVVPSFRGQGLGAAIINYVKPNFVRALESAVPWFERQGYTAIGSWKQGRSLRTRVLVRTSITKLAGRLRDKLKAESD